MRNLDYIGFKPVARAQVLAFVNIKINEMHKAYSVSFTEIDGDLMSADIIVQHVIEYIDGHQMVI